MLLICRFFSMGTKR